MSEDIQKIAEGLTKAQRKVVLTDDKWFNRQWKGCWQSLTMPTAQRLFALGLTDRADHLAKPTPLGQQVRAYLQGQQP